MTDHFDKCDKQPKLSEGCEVSFEELDAMTPAELAEAMERALDAMTEETYDSALIDAYLAALDRKAPIPEIPDVEGEVAGFQERVFDTFPALRTSTQKSSHRPRKLWRTLLTAATLTACLFGCMIAAQAAGVDVFGAIARWTDEVFSFGTVQPSTHVSESSNKESRPHIINAADLDEQVFSSLQDALEAYGITEVSAPTWIPEGYELDGIDITDLDDPEVLTFCAGYFLPDDSVPLGIIMSWYDDEPLFQIEKVDKPPEMFEVDGQAFYMIENEASYIVAWATNHFECQIGGTLEQEEVLREMVYSMFD